MTEVSVGVCRFCRRPRLLTHVQKMMAIATGSSIMHTVAIAIPCIGTQCVQKPCTTCVT